MSFDLKEIITQKIIEKLEDGIIPWHKPWTGTTNGAISHATGKPYSFLNQLLLEPGEYLTFAQARKEGGKIKKGAKADNIIFYQIRNIVEQDKKTGEEKIKSIPTLKYYKVFHIKYTEDIKPKLENKPIEKFEEHPNAETIINNYVSLNKIKLTHIAGDKACYSPTFDKITMPLKEQFISNNEYYSVLFHESIHSTGHKDRLNRLSFSSFGDTEYSKEELVAEMGAAYLMNYCSLDNEKTLTNNAAYIQGWIRNLKNNKDWVIYAASKAAKATNFILNIENNVTNARENEET